MPEHRIRFRGGWDLQAPEGGPGVARRLTLPTSWSPDLEGPVRLIRRFGRPPFDPTIESASLELRAVPGLRSARLNGVDLGLPAVGSVDRVVPLVEPLLERNTLTLEVAVDEALWVGSPGGWGAIALLIAPGAGPAG